MITGMIHIPMRRKMILAGLLAFAIPYILARADYVKPIRKQIKYALLALFCLGILFLTLLERSATVRQIELRPFWSYFRFYAEDVRWQVYMNVFVFVPFGFLLSFAADRKMKQAVLTGLVFSAVIETCQYVLRLGLCEFDDVFHNTLGTLIGYGYAVLLAVFLRIFGQKLDRLRAALRRGAVLACRAAVYWLRRAASAAGPWIALAPRIAGYWIRKGFRAAGPWIGLLIWIILYLIRKLAAAAGLLTGAAVRAVRKCLSGGKAHGLGKK